MHVSRKWATRRGVPATSEHRHVTSPISQPKLIEPSLRRCTERPNSLPPETTLSHTTCTTHRRANHHINHPAKNPRENDPSDASRSLCVLMFSPAVKHNGLLRIY